MDVNNVPFKSFNKYKSFSDVDKAQVKQKIKKETHDRRMPLIKSKLYMRKIFERVPGCFFMDLLEQPKGSDPQYYFIFIGTNNRYAFAYPINDKTAKTALETLKQFIEDNKGKPIIKLTSDGERAFESNLFTNYCSENGIMVKIVPDKAHSTFGIIDRFIRTLRDMNQPFNDSQGQQSDENHILFSPDKMKNFIDVYNNTFHNSIKCSPSEMYNDADLENEYIKKCLRQRAIQDQIKDFNLPEGSYVRYKMNAHDVKGKRRTQFSKEKYIITKRLGCRYVLQAKDGKTLTKSRYELIKADDNDIIGSTFKQNTRVNSGAIDTGRLYK